MWPEEYLSNIKKILVLANLGRNQILARLLGLEPCTLHKPLSLTQQCLSNLCGKITKPTTVTSGWRHMGLRKSRGLGTVSPRNSQGHFSNDGLLPDLNRITGQKSLTQIHLGSRTELNPGIWIPERSIMVSCTEYYGILNIIFWCVTKYWASLPFFARIWLVHESFGNVDMARMDTV